MTLSASSTLPTIFTPERIVDEADPDLPVKIFARRQFRQADRTIACEPAAVSGSLVPDVQALNHARHPGEPRFGHDDLHSADDDRARR